MSDTTYDLVVIGGGPGGYVAAIRAAQLGFKVACVEKEPVLGGTCLRVGCIPSKALLDSSQIYHEAQGKFARHGVKIAGVELDLDTMQGRKDKVVGDLTKGIAHLFKKNGIDHVRGTGRIRSASEVEVSGADGTSTLATRRVLIATGSAPRALPGMPFDEMRILSSTGALALPKVPRSMAVLGAGAIGLEMGSVWGRLGAEVTVVEAMDRIVPPMDHEMGRNLKRVLEKQGFTFHLGTMAKAHRVEGDQVVLELDKGGERLELAAEVVLVAIGRVPYTAGLGAEEAGVALDDRGRVRIDGDFRTNVEGIYAIGDVVEGPMLAHKAEEEGVAAVEKMAGHVAHVDHDTIPGVVYTHPELASVGLTEEEARERHGAIRVGKFPFAANGRARAMDDTDGMVKVIAADDTDRILGVHVLGARAADMIAEAGMAMAFKGSAEDMGITMHAHPTLPEAMKEAALAALGRALHV